MNEAGASGFCRAAGPLQLHPAPTGGNLGVDVLTPTLFLKNVQPARILWLPLGQPGSHLSPPLRAEVSPRRPCILVGSIRLTAL